MLIFKNRQEAGRLLAEKLIPYRNQNMVALGLPRGGVLVAAEIAKILKLPLDMVITKKITAPIDPEFAVAAVSENGFLVMEPGQEANAMEDWFLEQLQATKDEIIRRREVYLNGFPPLEIKEKIALIVDDGLATGLTMKAAIKDVRSREAHQIIVAVPVSPADTAEKIGELVEEIVVMEIPDIFLGSVGSYYQDFRQVSDEEVLAILKEKH